MEMVWYDVGGTPLERASETDSIWGSTREVLHNGRIVLFAQVHKWEAPAIDYVVVFGYKIGEYYPLNGRTAVKVELISLLDEKEVIREKVRSLTTGSINFW